MMKNRAFNRIAVPFVVAALSLMPGIASGAIISFNAIGSTTDGMTATDVAGAPGASAANWNNMRSVQGTPGGAITGSLTAGTVLDNSGATIPSMTVSWSGTGVANQAGGGTNSQKMFESEWDLFDSGGNTAVDDMTITVTNVPFALYDVYFYVQDANGVANRGGNVTANTITESIRMYTATGDIPGGPFSYVEANSPFTFNAATTNLGTFLKLENITGDTLALSMSSKNTPTPRLRFSGFQIVEAVPEPGVYVAAASLVAFVALRRRRR